MGFYEGTYIKHQLRATSTIPTNFSPRVLSVIVRFKNTQWVVNDNKRKRIPVFSVKKS